MKGATCYVIVTVEGKHLSFVGIAVIVGAVQYFINIAHECRAPDVGLVLFGVSANNVFLAKAKDRKSVIFSVVLHSLGEILREGLVIKIHILLLS